MTQKNVKEMTDKELFDERIAIGERLKIQTALRNGKTEYRTSYYVPDGGSDYRPIDAAALALILGHNKAEDGQRWADIMDEQNGRADGNYARGAHESVPE